MSKKHQGPISSDHLPAPMPHMLRRETVRTASFGGCGSPFGGGSVIAEGVNLSPRRAPLLSTRLPRGLMSYGRGSGTPHGMTWFDGCFIFAQGTGLYAADEDGTVSSLGTVSDTRKSFFTFGGRLYIYPDKLFMDNGYSMPRPVELDTGIIAGAEFGGKAVTLPKGYIWREMGFEAGDCLRVINADDVTPAPEGYYRITEVRGGTATLANTLASTYTSNARFQRAVPDLTECCVSGDRVYGIAGKDIYVSGAGSATDFFSYSVGDGTHPVRLHSDTDGDYTALSPWQGYVVFFKEDRICKLLGSRSDSYTLQESRGVGIPAELADTLCEVGNALCYASRGGVYLYRGQEPLRVSSFGDVTVTDGHGGSDGEVYCLALTFNGGERMSLLLPETGEWYPEDALSAGAILGHKGFLCILDGEGNIWKLSPAGRDPDCAFDERQIKGELLSSATLTPDHYGEPDGYRLAGLAIRATGAVGGALRVLIRYDEGAEEVALGEFSGGMTDRLLRIPLIPRPCDGSVLRLEMAGDWVIHAVLRTYERMGQ